MRERYSTAGVGETFVERVDATVYPAVQWTNGFPHPAAGRGVRGDKLLEALRNLEFGARRVIALPVGTKKGGYPGAGYLTGATVTEDDRKVAGAVLYEVTTRLPKYGAQPVEPWLLAQIKGGSQRLMMILTDLNLTDVGVSRLGQVWDAVLDSIIELPERLGNVTGSVLRSAGQAAGGFASGVTSGLGGFGVTGLLIGGGVLAAVLLLRR